MVNRIRTMNPRGLNKGFSSKFFLSSRVRHDTPEEGRRVYRPKRCMHNNEDEDNSPNILSDKKPFGSLVKFQSLAQSPMNQFSHPVMSTLVLLLY